MSENKRVLRRKAIQMFGNYFAGSIDFSMEKKYEIFQDFEGEPFKIVGVSPFSIMGEAPPELNQYAQGNRTNVRVKADIRKNFDEICEKAKCDWFVLDNSSALMGLTIIYEQFYSLLPEEKTDFMDDYFNDNPEVRENYLIPEDSGFNKWLRDQYDLFIETILRHYDAERIILVRSNVPRFRPQGGKIVKTEHTEKSGRLLRNLDNYFIRATKCVVTDTPVRFFEANENSPGRPFAMRQRDLQFAIERDILTEIEHPGSLPKGIMPPQTMADYIADGGADMTEILEYFRKRSYTPGDIAALFWLYDQAEDKDAFKNIANEAMNNKRAAARAYTKNLFERNLKKLQSYPYCMIDLKNAVFEDKVAVKFGAEQVFEISKKDGLKAFDILPKNKSDYSRFSAANYSCGIEDIEDALESVQANFGNVGNGAISFVLRFDKFENFVNSMHFIDFEYILKDELFVITIGRRRG